MTLCGILPASVFAKGLRAAVQRAGGVSLLITDPIVSAVAGGINKANDMRRTLPAIVDFRRGVRLRHHRDDALSISSRRRTPNVLSNREHRGTRSLSG